MSFKKFAEIAEDLKNDLVSIELEIRLRIPPQNIKFGKKKEITYYRSSIYPSLIFRSHKKGHIQSKELIEKRKIDGVNVFLSIEQIYLQSELKFALIEINKRVIYRVVINENPLVEIIKHNDEYMLEIEFNINNYNKIPKIISEYKCYYYPLSKPIEISSINLARKMTNMNEWCLSLKADGIHVTVLEKDKSRVLLFDNGKVRSINNKVDRKIIVPKNVYEAELMDDGTLLYFDCLMYNNKNITKLNYIERRKYIKHDNVKEIYIIENIDSIKKIMHQIPKIKTDGFIINNILKRELAYKSKFINTVDLKYKNGYLLLEREDISYRIPKTNYEYENDKIYEFDTDLNLVKERNDKIIANYKFPYDDNPLYKIAYGVGIPSLRCFHNKVKKEMLQMLPKSSLLDIGSGKGGDINKWINLKFKKVYAVDPFIDFRTHNKNIIEIKSTAKEVPSFIEYESVSILFVPWCDEFLDLILKSKYCILAIMSNPKNIKCDVFNLNFKDSLITLNIPGTETATNIKENKIDKDKVFSILKNNNWEIQKLEYSFTILTKEEKDLQSMYEYYYLKNVEIL